MSRVGGWGPTRRHRSHRRRGGRAGSAVVCAAVAALAVLLVPGRADAHAELLSTEPAAGEQLAAAPDQVVLHFSEAVDTSDDTIEVLDAEAERIDVGEPEHPGGERSSVAVSLPELDDGAYVVAWRVVSSDSHPIGGAFTFRVGDAGAAVAVDDQALIEDVLGGSRDGDTTLGAVYGVVRFAAFAGLTVLVGAVVFVAWLWPAGASDRRVRRLAGGAWLASVVATALSIPLQGAYAAGGTLADVLVTDVVADELGVRTGRSWVVRLLLLAATAVVLPRLSRALSARRPVAGQGPGERATPDQGSAPDQVAAAASATAAHASSPVASALTPDPAALTAARVVAVVGGIALLVTVSLTGHATSGDLVPLAFVADVVHLSGVSVWLGGLAVLVTAMLSTRAVEEADEAEAVVGRFSSVAFGAVVAIVASGTVQGWRQVGGYDALLETSYGRLLVVKVGLVAAMLVAAAVSRSWVRSRSQARAATLALSPGPGAAAASTSGASPGAARLSVLRRSVGAEVGLAVCVLAVTALLVNAVPGESAASDDGGPFSTQLTEDDIVLTLDVDPAAVGPVALHIFLNTPDGAPVLPEEVTADLSLPERDLGPLTVSLVDFGQGHYSAEGAEIPFEGDWDLELVVRTSDIDQTTFDVVVPVG